MKSGFFKKLRMGWKEMDTLEKVGLIFEALSDVGSSIIGLRVGAKLSEGCNILGKICIRTATTGLSIAAGDIASKALKESYGEPIAFLIGKAKAGTAKEEVAVDE